MKRFLCCAAAGVLLAPALSAFAEPIPVTGIAVVVNDTVITSGEVQQELNDQSTALAQRYANDRATYEKERVKLADDIFERRIEGKLILHDFLVGGYATNVLESVVDNEIQEILRRDFYNDRARLIQTLRAQGKTYETFRREQREKFIIEYMNYQNDSNVRKIIISPLKIEKYYQAHADEFKVDDQVKLRMIEVRKTSDSPGGAKELATEILDQINAGVPFAEMAAVNSSGSQRAEGGERGWVDRKFFRKELSDAAFALKPGEHSGVVETPDACYILMVEDSKPAHVKELADVRGDIERTLKNEESLRLRKLWIDRLKRKSFYRFY